MMAALRSPFFISLLSLALAAHDVLATIKCGFYKDNIIVLKNGETATINCTVFDLGLNSTTKPNFNLTKIFNNCPNEKLRKDINVTINKLGNKSLSIGLTFAAVSWGIGGEYVLFVGSANMTMQKKLQVRVSDVPVMPTMKNISFTNFMHHGDHVLALVATLPKTHKCSYKLKRAYKISYRSTGCMPHRQRNDILCEVDDDTDGFSEDLVCQADKTIVCENKQLKDCIYHMNITGSNVLGLSYLTNVRTPRLRYTVPALPARFLKVRATGPKTLSVSWLKPFCSEIGFSYSVRYVNLKNNISSKDSLVMNDAVLIKESIGKLNPYTKYRVCLKVLNRELDAWSKESCLENRTLEDVPSRAPEITNVLVRSMRQGNGKWESEIKWKVPSRQYWNGIPYLQVEYFELKNPQQSRTSKKLNFSTTKFVLKDLEKDRDYSVRVNLCTYGCKNSDWKNISFPAEKNSSKLLYIILGVLAVISVAVLLVVAYLCRRDRYRRLTNEPAVTMQNPSASDMTIYPRPVEGNYDEIEDQARGYDTPPQAEGHNDDLVEDSDHEQRLEDARLEITVANDFGAQSLDETELMPVRT